MYTIASGDQAIITGRGHRRHILYRQDGLRYDVDRRIQSVALNRHAQAGELRCIGVTCVPIRIRRHQHVRPGREPETVVDRDALHAAVHFSNLLNLLHGQARTAAEHHDRRAGPRQRRQRHAIGTVASSRAITSPAPLISRSIIFSSRVKCASICKSIAALKRAGTFSAPSVGLPVRSA